jgi:hypothetical protein
MNKNIKPGYFGTESDGSLVVNGGVVLSPCAEFSKEDIARLVLCANYCANAEDAQLSDPRSQLGIYKGKIISVGNY